MTDTLVKPRLVIHGRTVVGGIAEGEALVTHETISGWGGIDSATGTVIESRHALKGVSFANKILVFPGAKGSSGWSNAFHLARLRGTAPRAMIFTVDDHQDRLGRGGDADPDGDGLRCRSARGDPHGRLGARRRGCGDDQHLGQAAGLRAPLS